MENGKTATKKMNGIVSKLSSNMTVKVEVEQKYPHPKYGKIIKSHKNFLVHLPKKFENSIQVGDMVEIEESKPISKRKSWVITNKLS